MTTINQHWSYGYEAYGAQNTRANYQFRVGVRPAIEYNFFPESEQNSRFFRVNYGIETRFNDYVEETIYGDTKELVFLQSIRASLGYNQRWGSLEVGYRYRNYMHKFNFYTTGLSVTTNIRVTGNLSFNVNLEGNIIKDQIYLAKGDYTQEDILSGNVTLPSDFTIDSRFGFNYRFGSNLNNFVNRRFFGRGNFFSDN